MEIVKLNHSIDDTRYKELSFVEAIKEFERGKTIFVRLAHDLVIITNKEKSSSFDFDGDLYFFIEQEIPFREDAIIVTRHEILARYFREEMKINAKWVQHARPYEIKDKDMFGVLPVGMMSLARTVTCVSATMSDDEYEFMTDLEEYKRRVSRVNRYVVQCESLYVKEVESE